MQKNYRLQTIIQADLLSQRLSLLCPDPDSAALGLFELLINAIEHGNLGLGHEQKQILLRTDRYTEEINRRLSCPPYNSRYLDITVTFTPARLVFLIEDQGAGFDYAAYQAKSLSTNTTYHGRGILLAQTLGFSSLHYHPPGNRVEAVVLAPGPRKTRGDY